MIEVSLGKWGGGPFPSEKITRPIPKGAHVRTNRVGSHIYVLSLCSNSNSEKYLFVIVYLDVVFHH